MADVNYKDLYDKEVEAHKKTAQERDDLSQANELLSKRVNAPSKDKPAKLPVVKLNSGEFQWTVPTVNFQGTVLTAEEASKDKKICEKLVAMKFGGLQPVE